jgi:hypothetical protein
MRGLVLAGNHLHEGIGTQHTCLRGYILPLQETDAVREVNDPADGAWVSARAKLRVPGCNVRV